MAKYTAGEYIEFRFDTLSKWHKGIFDSYLPSGVRAFVFYRKDTSRVGLPYAIPVEYIRPVTQLSKDNPNLTFRRKVMVFDDF